jgi:hypothetical protein
VRALPTGMGLPAVGPGTPTILAIGMNPPTLYRERSNLTGHEVVG